MKKNTNCTICGNPRCSEHENARAYRLSRNFVDRLIHIPMDKDIAWAKYLIKADSPTPLVVWVNPPNSPLSNIPFWVTPVRVIHKIPAHIALRCVRAVGPAQSELQFIESSMPIQAHGSVLAMGKSPRGYFQVIEGPEGSSPPRGPIERSTILQADGVDVSDLSNLKGTPANIAGVFNLIEFQNIFYRHCGETLRIYDHRRESSDFAKIIISEKKADGKRWAHMNLYPSASSRAKGILRIFSRIDIPDFGEEAPSAYIFSSSSTSMRGWRTSHSTLVVYLYKSVREVEKLAHLWGIAEAFDVQNDMPGACLAYEDIMMELIAQKRLRIDSKAEKLYARYLACKARALNTAFQGEATNSWLLALKTIKKLVEVKV